MIEPEYWAQDTSSTRHWQFIRDCLLELNLSLLNRVSRHNSHRRSGNIFNSLFQNYKIMGIYAVKPEQAGHSRDKAVLQACKIANIPLHEFPTTGWCALCTTAINGAVRGQRLDSRLLIRLSPRPVRVLYPCPRQKQCDFSLQDRRQNTKGMGTALLLSRFYPINPLVICAIFPTRLRLGRLAAPFCLWPGTLSERGFTPSSCLRAGKQTLPAAALKGRSVLTRLSWRSFYSKAQISQILKRIICIRLFDDAPSAG